MNKTENTPMFITLFLMLALVAGCANQGNSLTGSAVNEFGGDMRVAVAAMGNDESSKISQGTGKAKYFLIYEGETLINQIENVYGRNGCTESVQVFIDEDVDIVVCGKFGSIVTTLLEEEGIQMVTARGRLVKDVIGDLN